MGHKIFKSKLRFQIRLDDFRAKIQPNTNDAETDLSVENVMEFYNYATNILLDDLSTIISTSNGSSTWRYLITYKNLLRSIQNFGVEMSLGLRFLGRTSLTDENFARFIEQHKLAAEYMKQGETFIGTLRENLDNVRNSTDFRRFNDMFII